MNKQLHSELRKEFQLERMILFSDAVFAIAITLLVIEIKIPEIPKALVTEEKILEGLAELIPKFVGFMISFLIIGNYWVVHHRLFGFVVNYSPKLLRLNLFFMFFIALMPFSTGFYSEYIMRHVATPVIFYTGNILFLGIINLLMWLHISNPRNNLSEGLPQTAARYFILRAIMVPLIFVLTFFLYLYFPRWAVYTPILIPVLMRRIRKSMEKKLESENRAKAIADSTVSNA